jgi:hypothetical protein
MKKNISLRSLFTLFVMSMFVLSCKSVAVLPTKEPLAKVDVKLLGKEIDKASTRIKTFRARVKAEYKDGKQQHQLSLNLRMEFDKTLWLSASILVPIAKLLITPTRVGFYEKFQKTYYNGDLSFINEQLGTTYSFSDLQNILVKLNSPFLFCQCKSIVFPCFKITKHFFLP